jgi:transcriptional regulator with XRE-family HTH domain
MTQRGYSDHWRTEDVAAQLGTTKASIGRYLTGERYPTLKVMRKIEREFGWKVINQIDLMPDEGHDQLYGMALLQILNENFGPADR